MQHISSRMSDKTKFIKFHTNLCVKRYHGLSLKLFGGHKSDMALRVTPDRYQTRKGVQPLEYVID